MDVYHIIRPQYNSQPPASKHLPHSNVDMKNNVQIVIMRKVRVSQFVLHLLEYDSTVNMRKPRNTP
jgi:hypothetical protein